MSVSTAASSPKSSLSSPSNRSNPSPRSVRFAPQLHAPPTAAAAAASSASVVAASSTGAIATAADPMHTASSSLILQRSGCSSVAALASLTELDLSNPPPPASALARAAGSSRSSADGRDEDGLMALDELDSMFPDEGDPSNSSGDDFDRMFARSAVPLTLSPAKRKESQQQQQLTEASPQLYLIPSSLWSLLPNLRVLNVSHNRLRTLSGFEAFRQLQSLDASWNELTTEGIEALADIRPEHMQLSSLQLVHNRIERLPACALTAVAPSLQCLDVQHNLIQSVEALRPLHGLVALQQLFIAGNDVEQAFTVAAASNGDAPAPFIGSSLLSYCCFYLPWLHSFDGTPISESERSGAWSEFGNALTPAELEAHVVAISTGMQALQRNAAAAEAAATTETVAAAAASHVDDSLGIDEDPFTGLLHPVLEEEDESRASPSKQQSRSAVVSPRSPEIDLAQFAPTSASALTTHVVSPNAAKMNGHVSPSSFSSSPSPSSPLRRPAQSSPLPIAPSPAASAEPPAASEHADLSFTSPLQPQQQQSPDRSHASRSSSVSAAFGSPFPAPRASASSGLDQSPPPAAGVQNHHRRAKTGGSSNTPKASLHSSGRSLSRSFFPSASGSSARSSAQQYSEKEIEEMAVEVARLRQKDEDQSTALASLRARFEASQEELAIKSRALDGAVADRAHAQQQMYELRRSVGFAQIDQSFEQWETRAEDGGGGGLTDRSLHSPRTPRSSSLQDSSLSGLPPLPKLSPPLSSDAPLSRSLVEQYEEHLRALQQHTQESVVRAEQEQLSLSDLARAVQATKQERALLARLALDAGHADDTDEYDLSDERDSPALGNQPAFAVAAHAVQSKRGELDAAQAAWSQTEKQLDSVTQDQLDTQAKLERLRTLSARSGDDVATRMHAAEVSSTLSHLDELVAEHGSLSQTHSLQESQVGVLDVELSTMLASLHKQFTLPSRHRTREAQAKLEAEEQRLAQEMRTKTKMLSVLEQRRANLAQDSSAFERALLAHEKAQLTETNAAQTVALRAKEQECSELQQRLAEAQVALEASKNAAVEATPAAAAVDVTARVDSLLRDTAARKSRVLTEMQEQSFSRFEEQTQKAWAHQLRAKHAEVIALQATVEELRTRATQAQMPGPHELELEQQLKSQVALMAARTETLLAKQSEIDTMRSERASMAEQIAALRLQMEAKPDAAAATAATAATKQLEIESLRTERAQLLEQLQVARTTAAAAPPDSTASLLSKQTEVDLLRAERSQLLEQLHALKSVELKQDTGAVAAKQLEIDALKNERLQLLEQLHLRAAAAAPSDAVASSAARISALLSEVESLRSDRSQLLNQVQAFTVGSQIAAASAATAAIPAPSRAAPSPPSSDLASAPRSAFASVPPSLPPSAAVTARSTVISPLPPDLPPPALPQSAGPSPRVPSPLARSSSGDAVRSHTGSPVDQLPTTPPLAPIPVESYVEQPAAFAGGPATFTFGAPLAPVVVQPVVAAAATAAVVGAPQAVTPPAVPLPLFGPVLPVAAYPAHFPPKPELRSKSSAASTEVTPRTRTHSGALVSAAATPLALAQLLETAAAVAAAAPRSVSRESGFSELEQLLSPPPDVHVPPQQQLRQMQQVASYEQFLQPPQTGAPPHQVEYLMPAAFAYQQPLPLPPSPQQPQLPQQQSLQTETGVSTAEPSHPLHSQSAPPLRSQQQHQQQQQSMDSSQQLLQPIAPQPQQQQSLPPPAPSRPPLSPRSLQEQILQLLAQQQQSMQAAVMMQQQKHEQQQQLQSAPITPPLPSMPAAQPSQAPLPPPQQPATSSPSIPSPSRVSEEAALTATAEKLLAAVTAAASKAVAASQPPPPAQQPALPAPAAATPETQQLQLIPAPVAPFPSSPPIPHPFDSPSPFSPLLNGGSSTNVRVASSSLVVSSASPVLAASPYVTRAEKMLSLAMAQGHLPARGTPLRELDDDGEASARNASSAVTRSRSPTLAEALGYRKPSSSAAAAAAFSRSSAASPYAAASGLTPAVVEKVLHMQKLTEQMQALQQQRNQIAADVGASDASAAVAAPSKPKPKRASAIPVPAPAAGAKKALAAAPIPPVSPAKPLRRPSSSPTRAAGKSASSSSSNGSVHPPRAPFGSAAAALESKAILAARAHSAATSPTRRRNRAPATAGLNGFEEEQEAETTHYEAARSRSPTRHPSASVAAPSSFSPNRVSSPALAARSNLPLPDLRALFAGVADDAPGEFSVFQPVHLSHSQAQMLAVSRAHQAAIAKQNVANMQLFNESSTPLSVSSVSSSASSLPSSARSEPIFLLPPQSQPPPQPHASTYAEQDHARTMAAFMNQSPAASLGSIFAQAQQQQPPQQQQRPLHTPLHSTLRHRPSVSPSTPPFSASSSTHSSARRPVASSASPPRIQPASRGPPDWSHLYSSGAPAPTAAAAFDPGDLIAREAALQQMKREQTRMIRAAREEQVQRETRIG